MSRASFSSFKRGEKLPPSVTMRNAVQNDQETSKEYDSSEEEDELSGLDDSSSNMAGSKAKNGKSTSGQSTCEEFDSDDSDGASPSKKKQVAPKSAEKSSDESSDDSGSEPEQSSLPIKSVSILAANASSLLRKKDSSSSVRPLSAAQRKFYKNEPPKPPK